MKHALEKVQHHVLGGVGVERNGQLQSTYTGEHVVQNRSSHNGVGAKSKKVEEEILVNSHSRPVVVVVGRQADQLDDDSDGLLQQGLAGVQIENSARPLALLTLSLLVFYFNTPVFAVTMRTNAPSRVPEKVLVIGVEVRKLLHCITCGCKCETGVCKSIVDTGKYKNQQTQLIVPFNRDSYDLTRAHM